MASAAHSTNNTVPFQFNASMEYHCTRRGTVEMLRTPTVPTRPREPSADAPPAPPADDTDPLPWFDLTMLPVDTTIMPIRAKTDTAPAAVVPGLST